jgi:ketosteroid isomerase-like protein
MSQENVDLVVKQFGDTNAREFAAVMDAWDDDVTLILYEDVGPVSTTVTGKVAVGEWFGDWFRQFVRGYRFDLEESRDFGDQVLVVAAHHGQGRRSGVTVEQRTAYVYTVRGGKISRIELWRHQEARDAALEAVGLSE